MAQQLYLNDQGVKTLLELVIGKINDMNHINKEIVATPDPNATIQSVVKNPQSNTMYLFKAGQSTTYELYMCEVTKDKTGGSMTNWLPIGKGSLDLSGVYTEENLKPLTTDEIKAIFDEVVSETSVAALSEE